MSGGLTEVCGLRLDGHLSPWGAARQRRRIWRSARAGSATALSTSPDSMAARTTGSPSTGWARTLFVRFHGLADATLDAATGTTIDVCAARRPEWPRCCQSPALAL